MRQPVGQATKLPKNAGAHARLTSQTPPLISRTARSPIWLVRHHKSAQFAVNRWHAIQIGPAANFGAQTLAHGIAGTIFSGAVLDLPDLALARPRPLQSRGAQYRPMSFVDAKPLPVAVGALSWRAFYRALRPHDCHDDRHEDRYAVGPASSYASRLRGSAWMRKAS